MAGFLTFLTSDKDLAAENKGQVGFFLLSAGETGWFDKFRARPGCIYPKLVNLSGDQP